MPRISNKAEFWQGLILISDTQGLNLIMGSVVDSDGYTARCQGSMLGTPQSCAGPVLLKRTSQ